jgi:ketosteroid isomerase-like protein
MSKALIDSFYQAFARRDAEGMVASYADDVRFSDPVFTDLRGERAKNMWRMLCELGKDLEITHSDVKVDGDRGSARWEAHYTFSATKKRVHNVVDASFVLANGKIVEHVDTFDLWRWSGMALGLPGKLLGWSPLLKGTIRKNAGKSLDTWSAKRG